MKVSNMVSSKGNDVPNQFIIECNGAETFQSYTSAIALRQANGVVLLDADKWNYSTTTGKYRNQFLGETKAATQRKIDSGEYILTDLN